MANTCSFILYNVYQKNRICFAELNRSISKKRFIVIEEEKFFFSKDIIRKYLNDLKQIPEINFTYRFDNKKNRFLIDVTQLEGTGVKIFFGMAVRCLWEGRNKIARHDMFRDIVDHYFRIKTLFGKKFTVLERLCIATNAFIIKDNENYNLNHIFSVETGCKILKDLSGLKNNVNSHFSLMYKEYCQYDTDSRINYIYKVIKNIPEPKLCTKETYLEIIKFVENAEN